MGLKIKPTVDRSKLVDGMMLNHDSKMAGLGVWRQCPDCNHVRPEHYMNHACIGKTKITCDVCGRNESKYWIDQATPFTEEPFFSNLCRTCSADIQRGHVPYPLTYYIKLWHIGVATPLLGLVVYEAFTIGMYAVLAFTFANILPFLVPILFAGMLAHAILGRRHG